MLEDGNKKTLGAGSHMLAAAEAGLHTFIQIALLFCYNFLN